MIIGIDASRANESKKTGVEWYAWSLIQALKKSIPPAHQVVLYSPTPLIGVLGELPPNWQSKVLRWPPKRLWTQVRLSWEMLMHRPDILFVPAHVFPIVHPTKTIMTIHDVAALHVPLSYSRFERWYSVFTARYAVQHLWRIIVPSECVKNDLLSFHHETNRECGMVVIPHGYDAQFFCDVSETAIQSIRNYYHLTKPYILSIGRLEEKKNTANLVQAWDILHSLDDKYREYDLLLVGKPGYGYGAVQEAIAQSPYKDRIRVLGWTEESHMYAIMHGAAMFVHPSLYEGFGIPLIEAMASRVPVVAVRGSGAVEEVGSDVIAYADDHSPQALANAIHGLVQDSNRCEALKDRGYVHAQKYSWQLCAQSTWQVMNNDSVEY